MVPRQVASVPVVADCQAPGLVEVRLDPFHRCDGRGGAVQEFVFNLDWWPVADLTVEPAMVEPVDIFGRRDLKVVDAPPGSFSADQFGFEQRVERLREGVIVTIALGPDRGNSLGISKTVGISNGSILNSAVAGDC